MGAPGLPLATAPTALTTTVSSRPQPFVEKMVGVVMRESQAARRGGAACTAHGGHPPTPPPAFVTTQSLGQHGRAAARPRACPGVTDRPAIEGGASFPDKGAEINSQTPHQSGDDKGALLLGGNTQGDGRGDSGGSQNRKIRDGCSMQGACT